MARIRKDNKSGCPGVRWEESKGRWVAGIQINKKRIHLGHFINLEDAAQAYKDAAIKYGREDYLLPGMTKAEYNKKDREVNRDRYKKYFKELYKNNKEKKKTYQKNRGLKLRLDVIKEYGGKCECCGEVEREFLAVDHINGKGNEHRRTFKLGGGYAMYYWLKKNGYPKDNYRLLCHNCNMAKAFYGFCPHERPRYQG